MFTKDDPRLALMRLYIFSRKVLKLSKKLCSEDVLSNLILVSLHIVPKTVRELAEQFDVEHSLMSTTISKLEKQNFVQKKLMNDTRYRKISLTEKGKNACKIIGEAMNAHSAKLFKSLSDDELVALGNLVNQANFDYEEPPPDISKLDS